MSFTIGPKDPREDLAGFKTYATKMGDLDPAKVEATIGGVIHGKGKRRGKNLEESDVKTGQTERGRESFGFWSHQWTREKDALVPIRPRETVHHCWLLQLCCKPCNIRGGLLCQKLK